MGQYQANVSWRPEHGKYIATMRVGGGTAVGEGATVGDALRVLAGVVDAVAEGLPGVVWKEADAEAEAISKAVWNDALARQAEQIRQDVEDLEP